MNNHNKKCAEAFTQVIKELAEKPGNLDALESYLSYHFPEWMQKYANTPEGLIYELRGFANMEV